MKWIIVLALLVSTVLTACNDHADASELGSENEEGIQMRIDTGVWVKLEGTAQKVDDHEFTLNARNSDNGFTAISWKGEKPTGKFPWSFVARGPIEGTLFQSRLESNIDYFSFYIESKEAMDSPGNITILEFGEPGGFVTGYFVVEKASKVNDDSGNKIGTMKIEGKFRVRRTS